MSDYFGDDYITITDEDGVEYELEVLARLEYKGSEYLGVCPAGAEDDELEVSILKVTEEDGEEILLAVTDDDELNDVYNLLLFDDEEDESDE